MTDKWNGDERRVDPAGLLSTEAQIGRALDRFRVGGVDAGEDPNMAHFRAGGAGEDPEKALLEAIDIPDFGRRVADTLHLLNGRLTPDQMRLREIVREQFEGEMALMKEWGIYDPENPLPRDARPPATAEEAFMRLIKGTKPEEVTAILAACADPRFQMDPVTSLRRMETAYVQRVQYMRFTEYLGNSPGRRTEYVFRESLIFGTVSDKPLEPGLTDNIDEWKMGVIDGVPTLKPYEDFASLNLPQRVKAAQDELTKRGLRIPNYRRYLLAQMRAISKLTHLDSCREQFTDDPYEPSGKKATGWTGVAAALHDGYANQEGASLGYVRNKAGLLGGRTNTIIMGKHEEKERRVFGIRHELLAR